MSTPATALPEVDRRGGFFDALAPGGKKVLFVLALIGVLFLFGFPAFWLILTSLRPGWAVFYVHRGTDFTIHNYFEVLQDGIVVRAFVNSFVIATLATVLSLAVTISSGYMLSRFKGPVASTWFGTIYVFRTVPYISWVLPLYFVTQWMGVFDTYAGLLLPHIAVHICFFSWLMKGFFDSIDPSMEYAALIDGCTRWGAFLRVALPSAIPGIAALGHPVLAVHLERVPVRADPDLAQHADDHGDHGAVRDRARHRVEPDERHRGDGDGPGAAGDHLRPEIRGSGPAGMSGRRSRQQRVG